jgi:hypothetical protein
MSKRLNLVGQKFNRLEVLALDSVKKGATQWLCKCDCGEIIIVAGFRLKNGHTRSCGCLNKESLSRIATKHGFSSHSAYHTYLNIIDRCYNTNNKMFKYYGGRNITVCERWLGLNGMENFLSDVGTRPPGHDLDRKDNDKGYSPDNCRWATRTDNMRNTRRTPEVEFNGKSQSLPAWADDIGCTPNALRYRFASRWSKEKALTTPSQRPKK